VVRYFVDVRPLGDDDVRMLAAQNFDIAGVDRRSGFIGIVGTEEELQKLSRMGYTYFLRDVSHPLDQGETALSDYTDPTEMSAFMDQVQANYPAIAKKVLIKDGLFEGHMIYAMKITKDVDLPNERPTFFMDCQHHAREVMTSEIALDMINYLTSRYATDSQVQTWVNSIEIWIIPIVNPDGAAYVFTGDNMWRGNRNPVCPVDVNRNYDFKWNGCGGSSGTCGAETYHGTAPDSEPETQGMVQAFSDSHSLFALTYHSYGEYLMYSYGCEDPNEMTVMNGIGQALNAILQDDTGATGGYATGPVWSTIYLVDGGSLDTQYGRYGTYSYVIEVNTGGFQPDYATWRNITVQRQRTAWQFFLDKTLNAPQIRGKVTDASSGAPLAATVSLQEVTYTHGEYPRKADPRGLYHWLTSANTTYHITFTMPSYCSRTETVAVGTGPATLNVTLAIPQVPSSVAANGNGNNRIDVSWSAVAGATEYRVLRSLTSGGPYAQIGTAAAPATTYADTPVSGSVTYYYVVRSFKDCESPNSAEASASTSGPCTQAPGFGGAVSVTNPAASTCSLTVSWNAATAYCGGPVTYRVHRSTTPVFTPSPATLIASGLSGTSFTDHGALAGGTNYYYIVRSVDAFNASEDENTLIKSGVPTGPYVSGTWSDNGGDTGTAKMVPTSNCGGPVSWTVSHLQNHTGGGTHSYRSVQAADADNASGVVPNVNCSSILSPPLSSATGPQISFWTQYNLETNWDGVVLETRVCGDANCTTGTWAVVTNTQLNPDYPSTLSSTVTPECGGACGDVYPYPGGDGSHYINDCDYPPTMQAFTGANATWTQYTATLPSSYNNVTMQFRFNLTTDCNTQNTGAYIDDISVTNVMVPGTCSAGTAPPPKEASPPSFPMTCAKASGSSVQMSYTPACGSLDHVIYRGAGPIVSALTWTSAACALGNIGRASFDPGTPTPGQFIYFVVAGQTTTKEGSYGKNSSGVERPEASGVGACDRPIDTSSTACP
jgi:hypothetical protein